MGAGGFIHKFGLLGTFFLVFLVLCDWIAIH